MPLDLKIEALRINIAGASGHEHRMDQIASRAAAIFGERLSERLSDASEPQWVKTLEARPINLNLNATGNEQAARDIADAWLEALALKLKL
jgi:hypothetical protein